MLLTLGADLYTVSKLLGHTSIRHTQRYAKIVNKKKDDAISKLDNL
jgi:site-specific recombinase XerD